jgi:hypothetical protein
MAVCIRAQESAPGSVDWNTVHAITAPLLAVTDVPRTARAKAAAAAVALIRRDERHLVWRGSPVNLETMVAIFDVLSDGKHRGGCPGSSNGNHEWAPSETNPVGTTPIRIPMKNRRCQRCGLQG